MTHFLKSDAGAVTVDWVVLTAALVGLGLATMGVVSSGVEDASGDVRDEMSGFVIKTSFAPSYTPFTPSNFNGMFLNLTNQDQSGAYIHAETELINLEQAWRNTVQTRIAAGDQTNAHLYMDNARAAERAAYERGVELSQNGPTYAELQAAYNAEFGS